MFPFSQPIFSETFQMEWRIPFDFPTGISGFPMEMVSTPLVNHFFPFIFFFFFWWRGSGAFKRYMYHINLRIINT